MAAKKASKKKSPIKIRPSKVGSFTAYCKRKGFKGVTAECIRMGKASKDPAIRKKATFASSARSWSKKRPKAKK